jgi:hypothetical protein
MEKREKLGSYFEILNNSAISKLKNGRENLIILKNIYFLILWSLP